MMPYTYSSLSTIHKSMEKKRNPAAPMCKAIARTIWDEHFSKGLNDSRTMHYSSENREVLERKLEFLEKTKELERSPKSDFISSRTLYGFAGIVGGLLLNLPLSSAAAEICSFLAKGPLPVVNSLLQSHLNYAISNAGVVISLLSAAYGRAGFMMGNEFSNVSLFVKYARKFSNQCWKDAFSANEEKK